PETPDVNVPFFPTCCCMMCRRSEYAVAAGNGARIVRDLAAWSLLEGKRPPGGGLFFNTRAEARESIRSELVHRVVFTAGFQSSFASEVLFMVVTEVGASHVLVLDAGDTLADFLTLNTFHVGQHAFLVEVPFCQVVGRQCGSVVSRQGDQVVEDTGFTGCISLEGADLLISQLGQVGLVVLDAHQAGTVVGGNILAFGNHGIEYLLTEVQRPVEGRAVVVDQLGVRY